VSLSELEDVVLVVPVGSGTIRVVVTWTVAVSVLAGVVSTVPVIVAVVVGAVVVSAAPPPVAIAAARSTPAAKITARRR
jgi:hypothetical protein